MEKANIPKIRFDKFNDDWEQRKLGEMATSFEYGLNVAAKEYDGENKYIRITDIDDNTHEFLTENLTSPDDDLTDAENYKLAKGDILFARTGASVGKSYIYRDSDGLVYYAGFLIRARIKEEYDVEFVFQNTLTDRYRKYIAVTSQRSGQPGVNAQEYSKFEIQVPEKEEQIKIGCYFRALDNLITLHQRKYEKLQMIKKSMLEKMFPQNGEKKPEIRFEGFTDDWEQRKLGEMGSTFTGLSGKTKEDFGHGEAKFITYMNVFSNPVANLEMTESVEIDTKQNSVKKGDVFFTTSSETSEEVGMSCVMPENKENIYLNSFCFGYRPTEKFDLDYLAYVLRTASFRKEMTFLAQGISRYNISKNKVMEVSIPVPNLEEQAMIGGYFSNLDHLITLHQRKLEKLRNIKKSMLEKMFV